MHYPNGRSPRYQGGVIPISILPGLEQLTLAVVRSDIWSEQQSRTMATV